MNPSFSTLLPKCQMFQHTYTWFFWNQELNVSGIRKNSWPAGSYAPLCMIRYHIHHADCTGLRLSEMNELLQGDHFFCIFFPRGNGHLFNCLSSTVSVAHYTWAPNKHCGPHTHTRTPAGMNVCTRTCATPPTQHVYWTELYSTLLLGKDCYAEISPSGVLQNVKNSYD